MIDIRILKKLNMIFLTLIKWKVNNIVKVLSEELSICFKKTQKRILLIRILISLNLIT